MSVRIIVCLGLFALFSFSFLVTFSILSLKKRSICEEEVFPKDLKFLEFDSIKNEFSRGFVTIPDGVERNDFSFHKEHSKKYTLYSSLGSEEYHCEGSCWCEEDETERRGSASSLKPLKRPIFVLLSALTFALGMEKATEYFEEKCQEEYSNSCSEESLIRSKVDSCDKLFEEDHEFSTFVEGTIVKDIEEDDKIDSLDTRTEPLEEWVCEGFCVDNGNIIDLNGLKLQKEFNCASLRTKKELSIAPDKMRELGGRGWKFIADNFVKTELKEFCQKNSAGSYTNVGGQKMNPNLCVGNQSGGRRTNINCKRRVSEVRKFLCRGNCLISGHLKSDLTIEMAEEFGCEDLKMEKEIEIAVEEMKEKRMTNAVITFNRFAKRRFQTQLLKHFCVRESKKRYHWESKSGRGNQWITVTLCRSMNTKLFPKDSGIYNLSIKCVQTFPRPESSDCKIMGW